MGAFIDLTGGVFGRLTVLSLGQTKVLPSGLRVIHWLCQCSCGAAAEVAGLKLRHGHTRSCGCLLNETRGVSSITHGASRGKTITGRSSPEYESWQSMKGRCLNPSDQKYPIYGGRGITVCAEWVDSFERFLADMGTRPSAQHTIDRIDTNGDYEPGNCRWATAREQARNRRTNRVIEFRGERRCLVEWSERLGIKACVIQRRLDLGWSTEDAMMKPIRSSKRRAA